MRTDTNFLAIVGSHLGFFEEWLPTADARHNAALELASHGVSTAISPEYPTHNTLAAHWGDTSEQLGQLCAFVYNLKQDTRRAAGQPVLVVRNGSLEDIERTHEPFDDDVEIDMGVLTEGVLLHGIGGDTSSSGRSVLGVETPLVRCGVMVPATDRVRLKVSMFGEVSSEALPETPGRPETLLAYLGCLSLKPDSRIYQQCRKTKRLRVVVGQQACQRVLGQLSEKQQTAVQSVS